MNLKTINRLFDTEDREKTQQSRKDLLDDQTSGPGVGTGALKHTWGDHD